MLPYRPPCSARLDTLLGESIVTPTGRPTVPLLLCLLLGGMWSGCGSGTTPPQREIREETLADARSVGHEASETDGSPSEASSGEIRLSDDPIWRPSLVQVLSNPGRYDGREVVVQGFLTVEFEGTAIYLSEDDARFGVRRNGFYVSLKGNTLGLNEKEIAGRFDRRYVWLAGKFNKDNRGHMDAWQGTIGEVSQLEPLVCRWSRKECGSPIGHSGVPAESRGGVRGK
jgi:hypothetical protein